MKIPARVRMFVARADHKLGLRMPSRAVPVAVVLGALVGWGLFWMAGEARAAEIAHGVWRWLTPGWGEAGRRAFAVIGGMFVAIAVTIVWPMKARLDPVAVLRRVRSVPLLPTVVMAVIVGLGFVWVGYALIDNLLDPAGGDPPTRIDVLRTALTTVAGVGGAVALVVTYRRQRDLEQGRFIERFGAATAQLGDPDPAVRIAGISAIASAADEATTPERRQQCIDVLCGYLRLPYSPETGAGGVTEIVKTRGPTPASVLNGVVETTHRRFRQDDRVVRDTVTRVIAAHLRAGAETSWQTCDFDFGGVIFEEANFSSVRFRSRVSFEKAVFLRKASFSGARFDQYASFAGVKFCEIAQFVDSSGAQMDFVGAHFAGSAFFGSAQFGEAAFFEKATFDGVADFDRAVIASAQFHAAVFKGEASFEWVDFGGYITFARAKFMSNAVFRRALFRGLGGFERATFFGVADFRAPRAWSDSVHFDWHLNPSAMANVWPKPPDWPPVICDGPLYPDLPPLP